MIQPISAEDLLFMVENHLPHTQWTYGGAFRYDAALLVLVENLSKNFPLRKPFSVAGGPACKWTLDWYTERRPMSLARFSETLEKYAALNIGVVLTFDNPFITDDMLADSYGTALVQELYRCDRVRKNSVCVASDRLALRIREICPKLMVCSHPNRLIVEQTRRTPALYNKLAEVYTNVCLHPVDAARPAIFTQLQHPEYFSVLVNDPLPRNSAVRREHLRLLADIRKDPYNADLRLHRARLIERDGWHVVDPASLRQKASCNLTHAETAALHAAGFRHFIVQGNQFRNEMTFLWDVFRCTLDFGPELSNKSALIAGSVMAMIGQAKNDMPSGLRDFQFTNYE
ncbi:MAG: hypothetical protein IJ993_07965 [Akkermansia sp.]|nr:hypothetical protein [Akkermansia sp.]